MYSIIRKGEAYINYAINKNVEKLILSEMLFKSKYKGLRICVQ